jgi:hypothetical protein
MPILLTGNLLGCNMVVPDDMLVDHPGFYQFQIALAQFDGARRQ